MVISFSEQEFISDTIQAAYLYSEKSSVTPDMMTFIVLAIAIISAVLAMGFIQDVIKKRGNPSNAIVLFFGVLSLISCILCFAWLLSDIQSSFSITESAYNEFITNYNIEYGDFAMSEDYIRELAEQFF